MIPQNGVCLYAYMRRKANMTGDDISDFEKPIIFKVRKISITKKSVEVGGLCYSNSQTFFDAYNLPLLQDDMKKDDIIIEIGSIDSSNAIIKNARIWRVDTVSIEFQKMRIIPKNNDEAERKAPKRILIQ